MNDFTLEGIQGRWSVSPHQPFKMAASLPSPPWQYNPAFHVVVIPVAVHSMPSHPTSAMVQQEYVGRKFFKYFTFPSEQIVDGELPEMSTTDFSASAYGKSTKIIVYLQMKIISDTLMVMRFPMLSGSE